MFRHTHDGITSKGEILRLDHSSRLPLHAQAERLLRQLIERVLPELVSGRQIQVIAAG